MHNGFHSEMARDRQAQLLRDSDFDRPAASHVTVNAATRRAEVEASQKPADRLISGTSRISLNPGSRLGLALIALGRPAPKRPGLSGC
jgi:hypothetical protein